MANEFGNYLDMQNTGGMPIEADDLEWHFDGINHAITQHLRRLGDNYIVQGCEESGGIISAGYVMLGGELLRVDAHARGANTHYAKQTVTYDATGQETYLDTTVNNTYAELRAAVTAVAGDLAYNGNNYGEQFRTANFAKTALTASADWDTSALYASIGIDGAFHLYGSATYSGTDISSGSLNVGTLTLGLGAISNGMWATFLVNGLDGIVNTKYMASLNNAISTNAVIRLNIELDHLGTTLTTGSVVLFYQSVPRFA